MPGILEKVHAGGGFRRGRIDGRLGVYRVYLLQWTKKDFRGKTKRVVGFL